jgi:hypothetical protein
MTQQRKILLGMRGVHKQEPLKPVQAISDILHSFNREDNPPDDPALLAQSVSAIKGVMHCKSAKMSVMGFARIGCW